MKRTDILLLAAALVLSTMLESSGGFGLAVRILAPLAFLACVTTPLVRGAKGRVTISHPGRPRPPLRSHPLRQPPGEYADLSHGKSRTLMFPL